MMSFCYGPDDDFQLIQRTFMEKHYQEFDDSEENKLIYTSIFNEYVRYFFPILCTYCFFVILLRRVSGLVFPPFIKYWVYMEQSLLIALCLFSSTVRICESKRYFLEP